MVRELALDRHAVYLLYLLKKGFPVRSLQRRVETRARTRAAAEDLDPG